MYDDLLVNVNAPVGAIQSAVTDVLPWVFAFFALDIVIALAWALLNKKILHGHGLDPMPDVPDEDPIDLSDPFHGDF